MPRLLRLTDRNPTIRLLAIEVYSLLFGISKIRGVYFLTYRCVGTRARPRVTPLAPQLIGLQVSGIRSISGRPYVALGVSVHSQVHKLSLKQIDRVFPPP